MLFALSFALLLFPQTVPAPAEPMAENAFDFSDPPEGTGFASDGSGRFVRCVPPAGQSHTPEFDAACRDVLKRNAKARRLTPLNRAAWLKGLSLSGGPRHATFELDVDPKGRVARCRVLRPSGSPSTDEEICIQLSRHAHFLVARSTDGNPVAATYHNDVQW